MCIIQCKSLTSVVVINPHVPVARADRKLYLAMDSVSAHIKIFGRPTFSLSTHHIIHYTLCASALHKIYFMLGAEEIWVFAPFQLHPSWAAWRLVT